MARYAVCVTAMLATCLLVQLAQAQAEPSSGASDPAAAPSSAALPLGRPYEAPALAFEQLPPDPPEYLKHNAAGIRFSYHPSTRERVRQLIEDAEAVRSELSDQLGGATLSRAWVRVAVGSSDYARLLPEGAPRGTAIVALSAARDDQPGTLIMRMGAPGTETSAATRASFRRGMAYLALDEAAGRGGLPRWLRIGHALTFSREAESARARTLWWASMEQRLIPLVDLDFHLTDSVEADGVAASEASDFVQFLLADERSSGFSQLVAASRQGASFDQALRQAYQADLSQLEGIWRQQLAKHKAFVPVLLGSTAVWLLIAVVVKIRSRRRPPVEQIEVPVPTVIAPKPRPRSRSSQPNLRIVHLGGRPQRDPDDDDDDAYADVPRVSHNGRWHTLH